MSLSLPPPGPQYNSENEAATRRLIESEDKRNRKVDNDLIISSPNGTKWKIKVSDAGVLSAST